MGERRIDHDRVKVMSRLFPQKVVAERMNISPRSVRRLVSPTSSGHSAPSLPSPDEEFFMMKMYREDFGMSYAEIGKRMGKTRQAVQQKLSDDGGLK